MAKTKPTYEIKDGVHCAQFIAGDQHIHFDFGEADVERVIQKMIQALSAGASLAPDANGSLHADWQGQSLIFHPRAAATLAGLRSERAYLLSLTLHKDYLEWATNFIPLKAGVTKQKPAPGNLDIPLAYLAVRPPPPGSGPEAQFTTEELENITEALSRHDTFIILGEPGCGKTTTLQKIAYDHALDCLKECTGQMPLFVRLSRQHDDSPFEFLEKTWNQRTGSSFADALFSGRILLLLDGVNELPRDDTLTQRLNDWRLFTEEHSAKTKIVFSGREKDYKGHLDLPRVLVRRLDEDRIGEYLRRNQAEGLLDALHKASPDARRRMQDLVENPLHLNMLVHYYRENGASLDNRGELFRWFAGALIAREKIYHPENDPGDVPEDVRSAVMAQLAYAMQVNKLGTVISMERAQELMPARISFKGKTYPVVAEEYFNFAKGARLLDPHMDEDIRFQHQMLHEYFAALELWRRFETGEALGHFWKTSRTMDEMPLANVGAWDPLPEPPATGWEVTTILACGLAGDSARLIEAVRQVNPALAGRCLDEAGISPPLLSGEGWGEVLHATQDDLLNELYDPDIHLRARLQAGYVLGKIGDPRFQAQDINGVKVVLPEMVPVPAGKYRIGSDEKDKDSFDSERPSQIIEIPAFSIGKWPVTNVEFDCFIKAGGYQDEQYWHTNLAKRWLRGEEVAGGQAKTFMNQRKILLDNPGWQDRLKDVLTPESIKVWEYAIGLKVDEAIEWYSKSISKKSRTQPAYWDDPQYDNPSQPVVGVTWFEANAYCAWLSAITGQPYRLPTEVEWETAARGPLTPGPSPKGRGGKGMRVYPWGNDWGPGKANSIEGRVLKPSPVGAYAAAGAGGPFGAEDQSGNVLNWTSSLYLPYPYNPAKSELPETEGERIVRGGSWDDFRRGCRCAFRAGLVPDDFLGLVGFRVVSPGSDIAGN